MNRQFSKDEEQVAKKHTTLDKYRNWTFHGDPYMSMIITAPFTITQVLIQ